MNKLWLLHFGVHYHIPQEIQDLCVDGTLIDESWRNDACPSFRVATTGKTGDDQAVVLWIEHPSRHQRISSSYRYAIKEHAANRPTFETDDLQAVLTFINKLAPEQQGGGI